MTKLIVLFLGISFFSFIAFGNTTSYVNWRDYTGKKAVFINVDAYYEVDNAALRDLRPIDVEKANEYFKYQVVFHLDGESFYVSTQNIGLKNGCAYAHHCIGDEVLFKPLERTGGSFGVQHAVIELIHLTHDHQLRFGVKYIDRETGKNKIEYNIKIVLIK